MDEFGSSVISITPTFFWKVLQVFETLVVCYDS